MHVGKLELLAKILLHKRDWHMERIAKASNQNYREDNAYRAVMYETLANVAREAAQELATLQALEAEYTRHFKSHHASDIMPTMNTIPLNASIGILDHPFVAHL